MKPKKTLKKPIVLAHRGASGNHPENTMRAFAAAQKDGADGIELDVFLTLDNVVVVTHDENTKRLTGKSRWIQKTTITDLQKLDFGEGEKIPTLDAVLKRFGHVFKVINIEIKSTGLLTDGIEEQVALLIKKHKLEKVVVVSSFNPLQLYRFQKILPHVAIAYLVDPSIKIFAFHHGVIKLIKPKQLNLDPSTFKSKNLRPLFSLGLPIWLWGMDPPQNWQQAFQIKASGYITDHPKKLRSQLESKKMSR